ncbi:hypothetical protein K488DRAFT_88917 [Vararia minispora EC-137]|uniref:Uncharacterized protein n=1 Tax=Vararia minispora EC-137 TaxID=1314806 RepID=A0ACB8QC55_9AGAM|nr:hypothetical protein K488DRAFT_88917 [Vararia minispora EC-137]
MALISRLPMELFSEIAKLVAANEPPFAARVISWPDPHRPVRYPEHGIGWIKLAQVCSLWRRRILVLPTLWANCLGSLPRALPDMTLLSESLAPVTLHVRENDRLFGMIDTVVGPLIHSRVTELITDYPITSRYAMGIMSNFFFQSTALQSLVLEGAASEISDQLITIDAPNLHTLRLRNCMVKCTSAKLINLDITFFKLIFYGWGKDILTLVDSSRESLETLRISLFENNAEEPVNENLDWWNELTALTPISLPRLRTLFIEDESPLVDLFIVPATASYTLSCSFASKWINRTSEMLLAATRTFPDALHAHVSAEEDVSEVVTDTHRLWVRFHRRPDCSDEPAVSVCMTDWPTGIRPNGNYPRLAEALSNGIADVQVKTLRFDPLRIPPPSYAAIIRAFRHITQLTIINPHVPRHDVLEIASHNLGLHDLRMLRLEGRGTGTVKDQKLALQRLRGQIAKLRAQCLRLERVQVAQSLSAYVKEERLEKGLEGLRGIVPHFDWRVGESEPALAADP